MSRALTAKQQEFLAIVKGHRGYWYEGCSWYYGNYSETKRIFESLIKRGIASSLVHDGDTIYFIQGASPSGRLKSVIPARFDPPEPVPRKPRAPKVLPFSAAIEAVECVKRFPDAKSHGQLRKLVQDALQTAYDRGQAGRASP